MTRHNLCIIWISLISGTYFKSCFGSLHEVYTYMIVLPATENNEFKIRTTYSIIQTFTNSEVCTNSTYSCYNCYIFVFSNVLLLLLQSMHFLTDSILPQWDFEPNSFQMSKPYRFKKWQAIRVSKKQNCMGNFKF